MEQLRNRISEDQVRYQLFAQNDYMNLRKDMSLRHVGISGMDVFTIDFSFIFTVSFCDVFANGVLL